MWKIFERMKIGRKNRLPEVSCIHCKVDCPDNPKFRSKYENDPKFSRQIKEVDGSGKNEG